MNRRSQMSTHGLMGLGAAVLFLAALLVVYAFGLFGPGDGRALYYFDSALFFIAQIGSLILLPELWGGKVAGDGIFGKITLGIFISALIALLIAQTASWFMNNPDRLFYPMGGILQLSGTLSTGLAFIRARRWDGWQRFVILFQSI